MDKRIWHILIFIIIVLLFYGSLEITGKITDSGELRVVIGPDNGTENETENETIVPSSGGGGGSYTSCDVEWRCYERNECNNYVESLNNAEINVSLYNLIEEKCIEEGIGLESCGYRSWDCYDLNECYDNSTRPEPWSVCLLGEKPKEIVVEFPYIGYLKDEEYKYVNFILVVILVVISLIIIYLSLRVLLRLYILVNKLEKIPKKRVKVVSKKNKRK